MAGCVSVRIMAIALPIDCASSISPSHSSGGSSVDPQYYRVFFDQRRIDTVGDPKQVLCFYRQIKASGHDEPCLQLLSTCSGGSSGFDQSDSVIESLQSPLATHKPHCDIDRRQY